MKKPIIVLIVILAILAGGAYAYYKQVQLEILASIDEQIIPGLKKQYRQAYGHEPEISYAKAEMNGRELTLSEIELFDPEWDLRATVKQKTATLLGWEWIWGEYRYALRGSAAEIKYGGSTTSIEGITCPDLSITPDGGAGAFKQLLIKEIKFTDDFGEKDKEGKPLFETVAVGNFTIGQGSWQKDLAGKYHLDAKDIEAGNDDFRLKLAAINGENYYMPGQADTGTWPAVESRGKVNGLVLMLQNQTFFTLRELTAFTEMANGKADHQTRALGMALSKELFAESKSLKGLDVDQLEADLTLEMDYNRDNRLFRYKKFLLDAKGMGSIFLSFEVPGVKIEHMLFNRIDEQEAFEMLHEAKVKSIHFRYTDKSLVPKLIKSYAKQQGTDEKTIKAQAELVISLAAVALKDAPQGDKIVKALIDFIKDPKELCFSAKPKAPVSLETLSQQDPVKIIEMLNLQPVCE